MKHPHFLEFTFLSEEGQFEEQINQEESPIWPLNKATMNGRDTIVHGSLILFNDDYSHVSKCGFCVHAPVCGSLHVTCK
jgi:hypothetical protein